MKEYRLPNGSFVALSAGFDVPEGATEVEKGTLQKTHTDNLQKEAEQNRKRVEAKR